MSTDTGESGLSRRRFISVTCKTASCLLFMAFGGSGVSGCGLCTNIAEVDTPVVNGAFRLSLEPGAPLADSGMAVFIKHSAIPVVAVQYAKGEVSALSGVCTHEACNIAKYNPEKKRYLCPCHNAEFDITGEPLWGPPRAALRKFETRVAGNELLIIL